MKNNLPLKKTTSKKSTVHPTKFVKNCLKNLPKNHQNCVKNHLKRPPKSSKDGPKNHPKTTTLLKTTHTSQDFCVRCRLLAQLVPIWSGPNLSRPVQDLSRKNSEPDNFSFFFDFRNYAFLLKQFLLLKQFYYLFAKRIQVLVSR